MASSAVAASARVLVADRVNGASRSAVAAVRALSAGGFQPVVAVSSGRSPAASSRACVGVVHVPGPGLPGFAEAIRRELARREYCGVLAASDAVLLELGLPGAALVDKTVLPGRVAEAGLAMPATRVFADRTTLLAAGAELDYPVVVKPARKFGPKAVARVAGSARELEAMDDAGPWVVQPYERGGLRAVSGVVHDGRLLAVVHQRYLRTWPAEAGVASAAVTTPPDRDLESRVLRLMTGHRGVFQVQLIGELVIDVNPRAYGSLPLAVAAGANLPAIAFTAEAGHVPELVRGRPGVRYRWLEGDIRSVAQGLRGGGTSPLDAVRAIRPRWATAHSVESVRDPGPMLARLMDVARRRWHV